MMLMIDFVHLYGVGQNRSAILNSNRVNTIGSTTESINAKKSKKKLIRLYKYRSAILEENFE